MTKENKTVILALNLREARIAAVDRDLAPDEWFYVSSERDLQGLRLAGCKQILGAGFWQRRDAGDIINALHVAQTFAI